MEVNKVELLGQTLIDLTQDTATANDVAQGKTFHLANGEQATGSYVNPLLSILDGSTTEFVCSDYNLTTIAKSRFMGFQNLETLDLTGVKDVPYGTAQGCGNLTSLTLDPEMLSIGSYAFQLCNNPNLTIDLNMNGSVSNYAFENCRIRSVKGTYTTIGGYAFEQTTDTLSILDEVDITVNGSIGSYAFFNNPYVSKFNIKPSSNVTSLSSNAFNSIGASRTNPATHVFNLDFRNSSFTATTSAAFGGTSVVSNSYFDIHFPNSLESIVISTFKYMNNSNFYYKNIPNLATTNAFINCTNFKNFFPYNLVRQAKASTNWSSSTFNIVSSIYGYAEENTFSLGDTLPLYDSDGYALTWYSDSAMTTQVTTVSDPTQIYYCVVGAKAAVKLKINSVNANCTLSDTLNTYTNDDWVPINKVVTVNANGEGINTQPYVFTLNGTNISNGDTYTTSTDNIVIMCAYWDGEHVPVFHDFSDNNWEQIAYAISTGSHRTYWPISTGSTVSKPITLTNGQVMNLRLTDSTANRYEFSDGSGYSQAVLEMNMCVPTDYRMNSTDTNQGGWPASEMSSQTMDIVYNMLPNDLKPLVKEVKVPSATSNDNSTLVYANNKCFLAAASEVYNSYNSYAYNEGAIFEYYNGTTDSVKIKQNNGSDIKYWLRSPYRTFSNYFCFVRTDGSISVDFANGFWGVSVCLVIG